MLSIMLAVTLLLAVAPSGALAAAPGRKQVLVEVQYESLCPDSIRFITQQLVPVYDRLGSENMMVHFIPYGKATTYATSTGYAFRCQHGATECYGNKLQACGLSRLLDDNSKQVQFVGCVMSADNPSSPGDQCATDAGLDVDELKTCASGREGEVLLASMGELTPATIKFVPTVRFNKEPRLPNQTKALYDLIQPVCDRLDQEARVDVCTSG